MCAHGPTQPYLHVHTVVPPGSRRPSQITDPTSSGVTCAWAGQARPSAIQCPLHQCPPNKTRSGFQSEVQAPAAWRFLRSNCCFHTHEVGAAGRWRRQRLSCCSLQAAPIQAGGKKNRVRPIFKSPRTVTYSSIRPPYLK